MSSHIPLQGDYSEIANQQLDELEANDPDRYNDILTMCEFVFSDLVGAQSTSSAVQTSRGIVLRLPVPGRRASAFWTSAGPRVEAIFPYP